MSVKLEYMHTVVLRLSSRAALPGLFIPGSRQCYVQLTVSGQVQVTVPYGCVSWSLETLRAK
jgi:hypothetical protein